MELRGACSFVQWWAGLSWYNRMGRGREMGLFGGSLVESVAGGKRVVKWPEGSGFLQCLGRELVVRLAGGERGAGEGGAYSAVVPICSPRMRRATASRSSSWAGVMSLARTA